MWKRSLIALLIPVLFLLTSPAAKAQGGPIGCCSKGQTAGIVAALVGAGAAIGIGVYYAIHHGHALRGCAAADPSGLQLVNEGDQRSYALTGDTAAIKTGDRVRVSGSKVKGDPNHRQFVVTKLSKDYGACKVASATP